MDLKEFKNRIQQLIDSTKLNVDVSGVAKVTDLTRTYWSASLAVKAGGGPIPSVSRNHYLQARAEFQRLPLSDFVFAKLAAVDFLMGPDLQSSRWQVMYLFRK